MTGTEYKVMSIVVWLVGLAMSLFGSGATPLKGLGLMALLATDICVSLPEVLGALGRATR